MDGAVESKVVAIVEQALRSSEERLEKRFGAKNGMNGWKRMWVIVGVLAAICTPVMVVLWGASERVTQLDGVVVTVQELKAEIRSLQNEVRSLRETVIRLDRNVQFPALTMPNSVNARIPLSTGVAP